MNPEQSAEERTIFESFSRAAGLTIRKFESRPDPEPDILCVTESGESIAFELTEIIDNIYSCKTARMLDSSISLYEHCNELPSSKLEILKRLFWNADISITFRTDLSNAKRKNQIQNIFDLLLEQPENFTGEIPNLPTRLKWYIERLSINRGSFNGPLFNTPFTTAVGEPTEERIASKMKKNYEPRGRLELLAYIDGNVMFPDEIWLSNLDRYFSTLDESCQFKKIHVYDHREKEIRRVWTRSV